MIGRSVQGLPKAIDIAGLSFTEASKTPPRRRRRTLAAFLTGAGLIVLGFGSLEAGVAAGLVNGSNSPIAFITSQVQDRFSALDGQATTPNIVWSSVDPEVKHKRKRVARRQPCRPGPDLAAPDRLRAPLRRLFFPDRPAVARRRSAQSRGGLFGPLSGCANAIVRRTGRVEQDRGRRLAAMARAIPRCRSPFAIAPPSTTPAPAIGARTRRSRC